VSGFGLAAVAMLAIGCGGGGGGSAAPDRGTVIARVDGDPIYSSYAQQRLASITSAHEATDQEVDVVDPSVRKQVLQSLVDDVIVAQEATRRGVDVSDSELAAEVEKVKNMSGPSDQFDKWLKDQGMTIEELERRVRNNLRWDAVKASVVAEVKVTEREVKAYYKKHADDYRTDVGVRPLFEVRPDIEDALLATKQNGEFVAWLKAARAKADVEVLDETWEDAR